jgi:hypothetical protein
MECPTCGKSLATEQGVRIHHATVHGERLPNRECAGSGSAFYDAQSRRTYCDECDADAGKANGNWSGAKESTNCERCDATFEYYPSDKEGVYCSDCVASSDEFLGDAHRKPAERVTTECEQCGEAMNILQSDVDRGEGRFCSRGCLADWLSENVVGEQHHQWQNGEPAYRGDWWRVRRKARERDDHECRICGTTTADEGRELDVHHIRPVREFDDPQDAHHLGNVVTLCRSCHRKAEAGSVPTPDPASER